MSEPMIGRNVNTNESASVNTFTLTTTPTVIAPANAKRIYFSVCMEPGTTTENVAIRLYPAATDTTFQGETLVRRTATNDNLLKQDWRMPTDNIYTGEISARCDSGSVNVYVTEY